MSKVKIEIYGHECEDTEMENTLVSLTCDEMEKLLKWCVHMRYFDIFGDRPTEMTLREFTNFVYSCRVAFIESVILSQIDKMALDDVMEYRTNELRIRRG